MQNKIEDLRGHLFATLADLRDKEKPMDIERALAIATVANSIIESAKVEVKYLDIVGGKSTGFIGSEPERPKIPPTAQPRLVNPRST